jgi:hypothetical protein
MKRGASIAKGAIGYHFSPEAFEKLEASILRLIDDVDSYMAEQRARTNAIIELAEFIKNINTNTELEPEENPGVVYRVGDVEGNFFSHGNFLRDVLWVSPGTIVPEELSKEEKRDFFIYIEVDGSVRPVRKWDWEAMEWEECQEEAK